MNTLDHGPIVATTRTPAALCGFILAGGTGIGPSGPITGN